jgi:hypothetical protein
MAAATDTHLGGSLLIVLLHPAAAAMAPSRTRRRSYSLWRAGPGAGEERRPRRHSDEAEANGAGR